ncbi:MAG: hypothetical protein HY744_29115 [Deltaproteobacteria bacterium]|nr:hypothetical protein [Deltaproteobacteria bacterium]
MLVCPKCGAWDDIARSRLASATEDALGIVLGVRPFRCLACYARFWRPGFLLNLRVLPVPCLAAPQGRIVLATFPGDVRFVPLTDESADCGF